MGYRRNRKSDFLAFKTADGKRDKSGKIVITWYVRVVRKWDPRALIGRMRLSFDTYLVQQQYQHQADYPGWTSEAAPLTPTDVLTSENAPQLPDQVCLK